MKNTADSLIAITQDLSESNSWYQTNIYTYQNMSLQSGIKGDSTSYWKYKFFERENYLKWIEKANSQKIIELRELFETEKLRNELYIKEQNITAEQNSKRRIITYLILSGILVLLILFILIRERILKIRVDERNDQLYRANEKYQMLVTESNHRIKNNLQMILSMLDYTRMELNEENDKILERISGKIYTISALHRHLNFDFHNEKVLLSTYFNEIIEHYQSIKNDLLKVEFNVGEVQIKSERIIYFGLILNELLSNSIKHNTLIETIRIDVRKQEGYYLFHYTDGATLPDKIDSGTGIQLITDLVRRLEGDDFIIDKNKGTFEFKFQP